MKQTLIDFYEWLIQKGYSKRVLPKSSLIDEYLKSINDAQTESQNVSENEDKRKICKHKDATCDEHFINGNDCRICKYY